MTANETPDRDNTGVSADVRKEMTRLLAERGDAIVSDSVAIFLCNGPQPLETDYCEHLGRRILGLVCASIKGSLAGERDALIELQRLVRDRSLPMQRLFSLVYLMERTVLDEIALDAGIGATSEPWPQVVHVIRRGSFDLLAAYCEASQQESTAALISDNLTTLYSRAMMEIVLSSEVQRAERFSFPIALAVFDVDCLSELNQSYGHGVGDRLLERF